MAETIKRPGAPAAAGDEANPFDELFEVEPEVLESKLRTWVTSPTPWRKLSGVHPELRLKVYRIIMAMATLGYRMMVTSGLRTDAEQQADYQIGRTKPGKIVTHIDGITVRSNHQERKSGRFAGYATAVDMTFVDANLKPSWDEKWPWPLYGAMVKGQGLVWGGDWPTLRDKPHAELFE